MPGHRRNTFALGGALAAALLARCGGGPASDPAPKPGAEAPTVRVEVAATRPMERAIAATGTLAARQESTLGAKVAGRLQTIAVDVGSRVRRGDLLVRIDPADYQLREQQARAALGQARAAVGLPLDGANDEVDPGSSTVVREAKALLDEAERNRQRAVDLSASGILSRSELDAIEAAYDVAKTRHDRAIEEARSGIGLLAQRRAEYEIARKQLSDTEVRAPFHGIVRERRGSVGEYLAIGAPLVSLVESDPLRLKLDVPEREASLVKVGQEVVLQVEGREANFAGALARISPSMDEESRMLRVEADVPASEGLRPGLFARARIVIDEAEPVLSVPNDALITFAGIEKVVVVEDGKAVEKPVTTGRRDGTWTEIVTGLEPGTMVVRAPGSLRGGQVVAVAASSGATASPVDGAATAR